MGTATQQLVYAHAETLQRSSCEMLGTRGEDRAQTQPTLAASGTTDELTPCPARS